MRGIRYRLGFLRKILAIIGVLGLHLLFWNCSCDRNESNSSSDKTGDSPDVDGGTSDNARYLDGSEEEPDGDSQNNQQTAGRDDQRDAQEKAGSENYGGSNSASAGGTYGDAENANEDSGATANSGTGGAPTVVPYETLQALPDTTARLCPDVSYSFGQADIFTGCDDICPNAHCVPKFIVGIGGAPEAAVNAFNPCDTDSVCIPDQIINTMGGLQSKKCRSIGNTEGVCVTACKQVNTTSLNPDYLPQDSCHETEVCIPCYDPIKGGLTDFNPCGNYSPNSCNEGAKEGGIVFDQCCNGNGICMPGLQDINPENASLLDRKECKGEDDLCLPRLFGVQIYLPAICETEDGTEGRCLSNCISSTLVEQASQRGCAAGESCIPCSEGACVINGDEPGRESDS